MRTFPQSTALSLSLVGLLCLGLWSVARLAATGDDNDDPRSNVDTPTDESTTNPTAAIEERIIYRGDPPYRVEMPILDGNLFLNHSDDFLLLGGANVQELRFSAGTRSGQRATVDFTQNAIAMLMSEQPYMEFSYQEKYYSLQILSRPYFFTMDFREISRPSVGLTNRFPPPE